MANAALIFFIVAILVLILVGVGLALFFFLRAEDEPPPGCSAIANTNKCFNLVVGSRNVSVYEFIAQGLIVNQTTQPGTTYYVTPSTTGLQGTTTRAFLWTLAEGRLRSGVYVILLPTALINIDIGELVLLEVGLFAENPTSDFNVVFDGINFFAFNGNTAALLTFGRDTPTGPIIFYGQGCPIDWIGNSGSVRSEPSNSNNRPLLLD